MKFRFGNLFDNKRFLIVFSLITAVIAWMIVVWQIDPITKEIVEGVPVDVTSEQLEQLQLANLNIVDGALSQVRVTVEGERYIVGGVKAPDITVTADLSGIQSRGTYDVKLTGTPKFKDFKVVNISPSTVRIKVDRLTKKKFTIETSFDGLSFSEDYLGSDPVVTPREVTISGPEVDLERIDKCLISAAFSEPLTDNMAETYPIQFLDSEGNPVEMENLTPDAETANVVIKVLKQKRLSVMFDYLDVPDNFPVQLLDYTFQSQGYIDVAGPADQVDALEVLNLGYISIYEITPDQVFDLPVELPDGFLNLSDINRIGVTFDLSNMVTSNYTIPGENIRVKNQPANYNVIITTPSISGVTMIGDAEALETLSAKDIVAEIDLSEQEIALGSSRLPLHISVPSGAFVWATGKYTAVVTINAKET